MLVSIENLGKISKCNIKLNGITVIAGSNNTGKSTIGEVLSTFFIELNNMDNKFRLYQRRELRRLVISLYREYSPKKSIDPDIELLSKYISDLINSNITVDNFLDKINQEYSIQNYDLKETKKQIFEVLNAKKEEIASYRLLSAYENNLNGKTRSVYTNENAKINIIIKKENNDIEFLRDEAYEINIRTHVNNSAIYINNPFCFDKINRMISLSSLSYFEKDLLLKLRNKNEDDSSNEEELSLNGNPLIEMRTRNLLDAVYEKMNIVLPGKIIFSEKYVYQTPNGKEIDIASLSTGIKSFAIIKKLLESNQLKEKDVLVLDEPEIHLHPEWIIIYAEMIVLLQKTFNLTLLITTHNSTFLDAIDFFSDKHGTRKYCNYYLSQNDENNEQLVHFEDVTNNIDKIFKKLVTPDMTLVKMRENFENDK